MPKRHRKKKSYSKALTHAQKKEVSHLSKVAVSRTEEKVHSMIGTNTYTSIIPLMTVGTNCIDLTALSATVAGSAYQSARTGVRIYNHRINVRINMLPNAAISTYNARIILFRWKPTTATYNPTDSLILAVPNSVVAGNSTNSMPAFNLNSQYQILYDRTYQIIPATTKTAQQVRISLYGKHLPKVSQFDNPATNNGANHIYMWIVSDNTALVNYNTYNWNVEYIYSDA